MLLFTTMYQWNEENGVMTVLDVEVMSRLSSKTRAGLPEGEVVDDAYLQDLVKNTQQRIKRGKPPQLLLRHNPDNNNSAPAEVIGRLSNPRFRDGWVRADLVVTNPEQQARIKRGELPNKSAEFVLKQRKLWGLSLIEGEEGHFGDLCPDLVLKGTVGEIVTAPAGFGVDLSHQGDTLLLSLHSKPMKLAKRPSMSDKEIKLAAFHSVKLQGGGVEVQSTPEAETVSVSEQPTAEEVATIASAAVEPVMTEVETLKAMIVQLQEELAALKGGDVALESDDPVDPDETKLMGDETDEEKKEKMASLKADSDLIRKSADTIRLNLLADEVLKSGSVLDRNQIVTKLSAYKGEEARKVGVDLLKLQSAPNKETIKDEPELLVEENYKTKLAAAYEASTMKKSGKTLKEYEMWTQKRGYDAAFKA